MKSTWAIIVNFRLKMLWWSSLFWNFSNPTLTTMISFLRYILVDLGCSNEQKLYHIHSHLQRVFLMCHGGCFYRLQHSTEKHDCWAWTTSCSNLVRAMCSIQRSLLYYRSFLSQLDLGLSLNPIRICLFDGINAQLDHNSTKNKKRGLGETFRPHN